jgi:hypothetical protein
MALDTRAKQFVPALDQNYRYQDNRKILEFDDGTEYTLREAAIIAKGKPNDDDLRAIHLVKRIFDGVVITEQEEKDFILFREGDNGNHVASPVAGGGDREGRTEKRAENGYKRRGRIKNKGPDDGADGVQLLLALP